MSKYLIPDFCEVENPVIEGLIPSFKLGDETVKVKGTILAGELVLYPVYFGEMENTYDWADEDVLAFAVAQLETFKIS